VRTWIDSGAFDVLHIHEPVTPSVSVQALWAAEIPVVATFHTAQESPVMLGAATKTVVRRSLERVAARIAVSEEARRTLERYSGLDAEVIPNGIFVSNFTGHASPGTRNALRLVFVGRVDEPRKGLEVLLRALPKVTAVHPNVELDVIGPGKLPRHLARLSRHAQVRFHGAQPDDVKVRMMRSSDVFVAPNTHGESFGIILIEAMAAGAAVVASDLVAFEALLKPDDCGVTFRTGDPSALAETLNAVLADSAGRQRRCESAGRAVLRYDWSVVSEQVEAVYQRCVARETS
jgi:phosphatidylinositol alpha-mannosyltransferase